MALPQNWALFWPEPRLRRPAAIRRICSLRDDALQPHAADVPEHSRTVAGQVAAILDRACRGVADQLRKSPLAVDQRQVVAVMLDASGMIWVMVDLGVAGVHRCQSRLTVIRALGPRPGVHGAPASPPYHSSAAPGGGRPLPPPDNRRRQGGGLAPATISSASGLKWWFRLSFTAAGPSLLTWNKRMHLEFGAFGRSFI